MMNMLKNVEAERPATAVVAAAGVVPTDFDFRSACAGIAQVSDC